MGSASVALSSPDDLLDAEILHLEAETEKFKAQTRLLNAIADLIAAD